ncbi:hypothetical protein H5410_041539 [Solanum commersonii]|uniref:Uncharacterized protein n=1 Tax=Solanum commersonii TaxID=4109 RepID=A0A9J5XS53_SOLCO|nr:hypothetical protein H5410_041539 [Solanum commersonii]
MLEELIIRLLTRWDSASPPSVLQGTSGSSIILSAIPPFTEVLLERFVPYSLTDQHRDEFNRLEQEATTSLVLSSGTFKSIIGHFTMIESSRHATQGSNIKKFYLQGMFSGYSSRGRDYLDQGTHGYQVSLVDAIIQSTNDAGGPRSSHTS